MLLEAVIENLLHHRIYIVFRLIPILDDVYMDRGMVIM